ncbi:DUF1353 domain-containing protein [Geodermatophilus sp. YIM 151500]|uniref:DUF1353 domain-containing protein n=1 Tax=Geodermatophilus sp. YIM 151500 TaxID=2984531 RepID=UPI0021E4AF23|nr:DUF1353 domain-containing protein [Geodermatophilus sp. YIM 151500]MCV2491806.1 DUF1353 domain-containing protein [Geodermatophilus sp. YIM 151500]
MPFVSDTLVVERVDERWWRTREPLVYLGRRDRFVVPAGLLTDFATVPRVVIWLIPQFGRYTMAAVLHDWLVTEGLRSGVVTSRQADGIFRRVMREQGVPVVRRWLMWAGVRLGALTQPRRRVGWVASAPGVIVISVLAAPVVLPPGVLIAVMLTVYGLVEHLVSLMTRRPPTDVRSLRT